MAHAINELENTPPEIAAEGCAAARGKAGWTVMQIGNLRWPDRDPVGANLLNITAAGGSLPFTQALLRGSLCNWLVVLCVWMAIEATEVTGKILTIYLPIMVFVASKFEHFNANMFFSPAGILAARNSEIEAATGFLEAKLVLVNMSGFLHNLLPVTIGNIIEVVLLVAVEYIVVFRERLSGKAE